jgi:endonuclease III
VIDLKIREDTEKLVRFIGNKKFEPITQRTPYYHMGATITDSVLQAGLNYRHVVYPRILQLLTKFSDYTTTCDFLILMQTIPLSSLINWKNESKLQRIHELSWVLFSNGVENENQLAVWLNIDESIKKLAQINGVGPKTIDYLGMLSGNQAIAIDRHLFKFLELAGIFNYSYHEANQVYSTAAELMNMSKYELDKKVWNYMAGAKAL